MQQVRQNVLIADDLVAQFQSVVARMAKAAAKDDLDLSPLRAESSRLYAGIWEHLDAAAAATQGAGRSTEGYQTIRTAPGLNAHVGVADVRSEVVGFIPGKAIVEGSVTTNANGIELARRAIATLKAVWSDIDWTPPPATPDVDLRPRGILSRLFGRR